jgi:uncharacterized protein YbdZ (MbtH family)
MPIEEQEDTTVYKVVVNHEEQYSIWPSDRDNPPGWYDAGKSGIKAECLTHIDKVWTDMRPLSLRKQMEEAARAPPPEPREREAPTQDSTGDDLVRRLATGSHPVEMSLRPSKSVNIFRECIDRGYVHVKFTATKGGTELGVRLDQNASNLNQADFENQTGTAHLVGSLTLNYVKVRCIADIDLTTLAGRGHLEVVDGDTTRSW